MKLTVFHSDKGDCALLTSRDGKRMLIDGGMSVSYTATVAAELSKLRSASKNKKIDVVYVSHIDDDHIGGVLRMLDDAIDWRVFDHKKSKGASVKQPSSPRPPEIGQIWHNGFRDQVGDNAGPIENQLAASATVLAGALTNSALVDGLRTAVEEHQDLAESVQKAVQLGRRIRDGELGIPLNTPAKGKLMMLRGKSPAIRIGSMSARVIAPFPPDLERLRTEWDAWLRSSKSILSKINADSKRVESELGSAVATVFTSSLAANAASVALSLADATALVLKSTQKPLGRRTQITTPNLASLMLLVTEGGRSILLTGDGFADDALDGLKKLKQLDGDGLHVNVLKVPHHGAADNMTDRFARAITADHYVFCGNGFMANPETVVIQRLFDARLGAAELRSTNPQVGDKFTFWFNCSSAVPNVAKQKRHMAAVEKLVAALKKRSKGQMDARFLGPDSASFEISI